MSASSIQLKKLWWAGPLTVLSAIVGGVDRAYHCKDNIAATLRSRACDNHVANHADSCSLYWRGIGVRAGGAFCEETDTHIYHHSLDISCDQLSA